MSKEGKTKIVLILVEGKSDITALEIYFENYFEKYYRDSNLIPITQRVVAFETGGDLTSIKGIEGQEIKREVGDAIRRALNKHHLEREDLKSVIHIMDTDGAFIPDEKIVFDPLSSKLFYGETEIRTNDVESTKNRNDQKSRNMRILSGTKMIGIPGKGVNKSGNKKTVKIPYQAFYMSCNLDHVIGDRNNLSDKEKKDLAEDFSEKFENIEDFRNFIINSSFSVCNGHTYQTSWDFIQQNTNSLNRFTNLGIFFNHETVDKISK